MRPAAKRATRADDVVAWIALLWQAASISSASRWLCIIQIIRIRQPTHWHTPARAQICVAVAACQIRSSVAFAADRSAFQSDFSCSRFQLPAHGEWRISHGASRSTVSLCHSNVNVRGPTHSLFGQHVLKINNIFKPDSLPWHALGRCWIIMYSAEYETSNIKHFSCRMWVIYY